MKPIDNLNITLKDTLQSSLTPRSKVSMAASCFSIYAFEALKRELEGINELRFLFTSPTFTADKTPREKREFYIPRLGRERNLYGTEFELKLRNELSQKAIGSIINVKEQSDMDSFLSGNPTSFFNDSIRGLDDFELICFLIVK